MILVWLGVIYLFVGLIFFLVVGLSVGYWSVEGALAWPYTLYLINNISM